MSPRQPDTKPASLTPLCVTPQPPGDMRTWREACWGDAFSQGPWVKTPCGALGFIKAKQNTKHRLIICQFRHTQCDLKPNGGASPWGCCFPSQRRNPRSGARGMSWRRTNDGVPVTCLPVCPWERQKKNGDKSPLCSWQSQSVSLGNRADPRASVAGQRWAAVIKDLAASEIPVQREATPTSLLFTCPGGSLWVG